MLFGLAATAPAADKTLIDYFLPMPVQGKLTKEIWGADNVLPRDPDNGLEDTTIKQWCYWDGQIIKGPDGRFHMFASRWDQAKGHNGWFGSLAVHAVSNKAIGPYKDAGLAWPENQGGKGHNVTALVLPDKRYAVVVSETRPGDVFVSQSLEGPWEQLGSIKVDANGFNQRDARMSNVSVMLRPDGKFEIVARSGAIWISADGILGPYKLQGPSIYPGMPGLPTRNLEDPVIWYSGGMYHIVVNCWSERKAFHLTSADGIANWGRIATGLDDHELVFAAGRSRGIRIDRAAAVSWERRSPRGVLRSPCSTCRRSGSGNEPRQQVFCGAVRWTALDYATAKGQGRAEGFPR